MRVSELLQEAKSTHDFRHGNTLADIPFWPPKNDPQYIEPEDGFHFVFSKGQLNLSSTSNEVYSKFVSDPAHKKFIGAKIDSKDISTLTKGKTPKDLWNHLGGLVNLKTDTITIAKEDADNKLRSRVIYDIKDFKNALISLKKFGVTGAFKVKGTAAPINGKTVDEILEMTNPTDEIFSGKKVTMYHGTSISRSEAIVQKGLQPNKGTDVYVDLIKDYSEHNVYLAVDAKTAEFYGKRQAKKDGDDQYVVFKVEVPDSAKIVADDAFAQWGGVVKGHTHQAIKGGLGENGSVGYKGRIPPKFVSLISTKKA